MHPSIDFVSGWNILIAAAMALTSYFAGIRSNRTNTRDALKESAEGWKSLAEVKSNEVDAVQERLTKLETTNSELYKNYCKALEMNLQLQTDLKEAQRGLSTMREMQRELDDSRRENAELRERLAETERKIADLQDRDSRRATGRRRSPSPPA